MIRRLALLLAGGAALASCTTGAEPAQRSPEKQQELQKLTAGKTPGAPVSCLQNYNATDQRIIDDRTVAYPLGARTVYVMQLSPGCHMLGSGNYALLTKQFGGMGMCRGDIVRVIDTTSHVTVGSCGIDQIIPYRVPGS